MPIRFECRRCESRMKVPDGSEGRKVRCPKCSLSQIIPGVPASATRGPVVVERKHQREAVGAAVGRSGGHADSSDEPAEEARQVDDESIDIHGSGDSSINEDELLNAADALQGVDSLDSSGSSDSAETDCDESVAGDDVAMGRDAAESFDDDVALSGDGDLALAGDALDEFDDADIAEDHDQDYNSDVDDQPNDNAMMLVDDGSFDDGEMSTDDVALGSAEVGGGLALAGDALDDEPVDDFIGDDDLEASDDVPDPLDDALAYVDEQMAAAGKSGHDETASADVATNAPANAHDDAESDDTDLSETELAAEGAILDDGEASSELANETQDDVISDSIGTSEDTDPEPAEAAKTGWREAELSQDAVTRMDALIRAKKQPAQPADFSDSPMAADSAAADETNSNAAAETDDLGEEVSDISLPDTVISDEADGNTVEANDYGVADLAHEEDKADPARATDAACFEQGDQLKHGGEEETTAADVAVDGAEAIAPDDSEAMLFDDGAAEDAAPENEAPSAASSNTSAAPATVEPGDGPDRPTRDDSYKWARPAVAAATGVAGAAVGQAAVSKDRPSAPPAMQTTPKPNPQRSGDGDSADSHATPPSVHREPPAVIREAIARKQALKDQSNAEHAAATRAVVGATADAFSADEAVSNAATETAGRQGSPGSRPNRRAPQYLALWAASMAVRLGALVLGGYALATAGNFTVVAVFVTLSFASLMWLAGEAASAFRDFVRNSYKS